MVCPSRRVTLWKGRLHEEGGGARHVCRRVRVGAVRQREEGAVRGRPIAGRQAGGGSAEISGRRGEVKVRVQL